MTPFACVQQRYKNLTKPKPTKGPWTVEEDDKLRELVDELGSEKWVRCFRHSCVPSPNTAEPLCAPDRS